MDKTEKTNLWFIVMSTALAAEIFVVDLSLPLGVAGGVLYVALVLLSWWAPWSRFSLVAATVGT